MSLKDLKMNEKIIQITAARGPAECMFVVAKVVKLFLAAVKAEGIKYTVLSREKGDEKNTLRSAHILLEGKCLDAFVQEWEGTIQWVGQSPYRKFHKRKNWFVAVKTLSQANMTEVELKDSEIYYETFRAGGPGGQHVNKVETAVRATHLPTGISAVSRDSKSQLQNRKAARKKLQEAIRNKRLETAKEIDKTSWIQNTDLERGNPVKVFKGNDFKPNHKPKKYRQERQKHKKMIE